MVRWNPRTLYSKIFPDPGECDRFLTEVCTMAWHTEHDRGVPMAMNAAPLIARHPHYEQAIRAWEARFDEMIDGVIPQTLAVMGDLHARGVAMYGLTNMPAEKWPMVQALSPAFGLFSDVVVSADEGVVKPDPRAFEIACARSGMSPAELFFVDDSPANIEAAHRMGFYVHLFDDPAGLRPALESRGLL
ncbi:MAG: HAD family hydrolase [Caulobacterales bacterium 32-69-10]|nr:MAG: HAD family hydrolase [Caulobacterales bacterium 32-69-10]